MRSRHTRAVAQRVAPRARCAPDACHSVTPAQACRLAQRQALLAGTILAGVVLLTALAGAPLCAESGAGGASGPFQGGVGGTGFTGNAGANGNANGGGGGGAGGVGGTAVTAAPAAKQGKITITR
jgi:hypothetical protein